MAFSQRVRLLRASACVTAVTLLLGGCEGGRSDDRPLPKKTVETAAPRKPGSLHTGALAAYRAMWRDLAAASETSDEASPRLDDHATGGALELLKYGLRKAKADNVVSKGTPRVDPQVVSATSQEVVLKDCVDSTRWLEYKLNGKLKNDVPGSHEKAEATVLLNGGTWKVSKLYLHAAGSC